MSPDEHDHAADAPTLASDSVSDPATEPVAASGPASNAAVPARPAISRARLIWVDVLVTITTILLVIGIFAIWANRLLFSPDNWSNTSTQLLQNQNVRSTAADYIVDQLYANVNVAGLLKQGLPSQLQGLADPAAGALRNAAVQGVELALTEPHIQTLWAQANRAAAQTFIDVVRGGKGPVGTKHGQVTLDLGGILQNVAGRLGLPSDVSSKLPPNIATLTVFKSDQLRFVQDAGNAIQGLALWLNIIVPLLYILALVLARGHRRRTLITIGFAGILAGVLVILGRSIIGSQVPGSLTDDASLQLTIRAVYSIASSILADIAGAVILIGIVLVIAGWFAGPARLSRIAREAIAPFLREQPAATFGIVLAIMVLVFIWQPIPSTSKPIGIAVYTLLALFGTWLLMRQTAEEFPDARAGAAAQAVRTRLASIRVRRQNPNGSSAARPASLADQLNQLADLRDSGSLTPEEYQSAKTRLLNG
jgi:Short C-terminal domain